MDTASPLTLSAARSASVSTSSAGDASLVGVLRGVNGNSRMARRFREIVGALADDCGGPDKVSETTRIVIKQAATLALRIEALQTQVLTGEAVDDEELVRLSNVLARLLHRLRKAVPAKASSPLAAHFSRPPVREAAE
jgi:hypothetical protein